MSALTRLLELRDAGAVKRYHTARMLRHQNNAEHSYGVAMIVLHVEPLASAQLIKAALYHDLPELMTGDVPAHVKWDNPALCVELDKIEAWFNDRTGLDMDGLDAQEQHILKWADMFELVLWCREEWRMGNLYARDIMRKGIAFLLDNHGPCNRIAAEMINDLMEDVTNEQR